MKSSKCCSQGEHFTLLSLPYYTGKGNKAARWTFLLNKLITSFFLGMLLQCIKQWFNSVMLLLLIEPVFSFTKIAEFNTMYHKVKTSSLSKQGLHRYIHVWYLKVRNILIKLLCFPNYKYYKFSPMQYFFHTKYYYGKL